MSSTTDLGAFDRDLVRTLRAKADQVLVADRPFRPAAGPTAAIRLESNRPRRGGRMLAATAVVVMLVAGAAAVQRMDTVRDRDNGMPLTSSASTTSMANKDGVVAFLPGTLPQGWALKDLIPGRHSVLDHPDIWQLFGDEATATPSRRVLVGRVVVGPQWAEIDAPTHTIHGQPAEVGPSDELLAPAGALQALWFEGAILHKSISVGVSEADLVAFLESLTPYEIPATGFTTSADSDLAEIDAVTVHERYNASAGYAGPGGEELRVTTESPDRYGNLLNRLAGEPGAGGLVMRETGKGHPIVSVARDDGWSIQIVSESSIAPEVAVLDELLASVRPVSPQQFLDVGLAEPLTVTGTVGGSRVDVHGTASAPLVMCLTPAVGGPACDIADHHWDIDVAAGSVIIDGQWVLMVVSDSKFAPTVQPDPNSSTADPEDTSQHLRGERVQDGDQVIGLFTIPPDVDTVGVTVPVDKDVPIDGMLGVETVGRDYDRPRG